MNPDRIKSMKISVKIVSTEMFFQMRAYIFEGMCQTLSQPLRYGKAYINIVEG